MAEAESIVEATLDITITPTVERDYARRGVSRRYDWITR